MLKRLSEEQKIAVLEEKNVLLIACPGSGKTRTLTYKIAHELKKIENSKQKIIALTFTNRAANEIEKRITNLNINTSNLWTGTIHSFCIEWILRPYMSQLEELKNGFLVADQYTSEKIILSLKEKYSINRWKKISTKYLISGEKEEIQYKKLIDEYHSILKKEKLIDFEQILYYSYKILIDFPKVPIILKSIFHLICIDEYQDIQELQYALLGKIVEVKSKLCKIFMVGDKDQAIYKSLGGVVKSKEEIKDIFNINNFSLKTLSGNYRSHPKIIEFYENFQLFKIKIEALNKILEDDSKLVYNKEITKDEIGNEITKIIKERLNKGIPEEEICVIAPDWYLAIPMARELQKLLPEVNFDAIGISPMAANKDNFFFKLARIFLTPPAPNKIIIRKKWASELIKELSCLGLNILENSSTQSKEFLKITNSISSDKKKGLNYLEECFKFFFNRIEIDIFANSFLTLQWKIFFEASQKKIMDHKFCDNTESFFKIFNTKSGIVINSCYGVKGEEFDTVIAFGLLDGKIPHWADEDKETSAKNLLYVICSRAKSHLYLISEKQRLNGLRKELLPTPQLLRINYEYDS